MYTWFFNKWHEALFEKTTQRYLVRNDYFYIWSQLSISVHIPRYSLTLTLCFLIHRIKYRKKWNLKFNSASRFHFGFILSNLRTRLFLLCRSDRGVLLVLSCTIIGCTLISLCFLFGLEGSFISSPVTLVFGIWIFIIWGNAFVRSTYRNSLIWTGFVFIFTLFCYTIFWNCCKTEGKLQ